MPMRTILRDFPGDMPRWATNTGRTVEPGETDKDIGHVAGTKAVARWNNWLSKAVFDWIKFVKSISISNWFGTVIGAAAGPVSNMIYFPAQDYFVGTEGTGLLYGLDGYDWNAGGTYTGAANFHTAAIDSLRFMFGRQGTSSQIRYTTNVTSGAMTETTTVTLPQSISAIETKYPTADDIVVADDYGNIKFASVVTGTFASPSVAPSYTPGTTYAARGLHYISDDKFILITKNGGTYVTTDGGDNWAAAGGTITVGSGEVYHSAYNGDSNRIVAIGNFTTDVTSYAYSDDLGVTWVMGTGLAVEASVYCPIYYAGHDMFVVGGSGYVSTSVDNGETWTKTVMPYQVGSAIDIGCDGRKFVLGASGTSGAVSLAAGHI